MLLRLTEERTSESRVGSPGSPVSYDLNAGKGKLAGNGFIDVAIVE